MMLNKYINKILHKKEIPTKFFGEHKELKNEN